MLEKSSLDKILLVVNPVSGDIDKQSRVRQVQAWLPDQVELTVLETTGKNDPARITTAIGSNNPDRILVMGGDGTLRDVAEANQSPGKSIGILPMGSANGLATALELPMNLDEALPLAMGGDLLELDLLCVDNQLCLHIGDLGLNAELIRNYDQGDIRGYLGYAKNVIPTLHRTNAPYEFNIQVNGRNLTRKAVVLAFTNVSKYGTGALVNPDARPDDGQFELLIFKKFDLLEILKTLAGKTSMEKDFVEIISTTHAHIDCAEASFLQLDGEFRGRYHSVDVSLYSEKLLVAVGVSN